jgi:hypothetical protein
MRKPHHSFASSATVKPIFWKIALAVFLCWPTGLKAEEKPRIDFWLINTRCAPVSGDWEQGKQRIRFWQLGENRQWNAATAESFAESGDTKTPVVFLVHGNRTSSDESVIFAWPIYRWLCREAGPRSFRVAIWSWPSMRTHRRNRPDIQTKACYCDSQSYYLADCLRNLKPETPVSLVGYSFGARIVSGGLHLLGGGTVAGRCLPQSAGQGASPRRTGPIRAALIAGALDCQALAPGQANGLAAAQVEGMLITENGCDRALRWYPRLYGRGGPEALGFVGPCSFNGENIQLFDATCCVGKSHDWEGYIYCPSLFQFLPHYLFADGKTAAALSSL